MLEPDPELAVAYGIFSVRQARAAGYREANVKRLIRHGTWNRLDRGVLVAAGREGRPEDDFVIAVLKAGPGAVVGFESAALVHGWELRSPPRRVQLIRPDHASSGDAYRTHLGLDEIAICGVLRVTAPLRTALDIAATRDFHTAVITLDSAMRSRQVSHDQLINLFGRSRRSGVLRARAALAVSDPLSGSIPESEARLLFLEAGLPPFQSQFVVKSGPRFLARVDFAWEQAKLAVEIDGFAYHSGASDFQRDRTTQNAVQLDGWLILRFTVADIRNRPDYVLAQIRRALADRARAA